MLRNQICEYNAVKFHAGYELTNHAEGCLCYQTYPGNNLQRLRESEEKRFKRSVLQSSKKIKTIIAAMKSLKASQASERHLLLKKTLYPVTLASDSNAKLVL